MTEEEALEKGIEYIQANYPNANEFVMVDWEPAKGRFSIGHLMYYTEEAVHSYVGQFQGLTDEHIGKPSEYWVEEFAVEEKELDCWFYSNYPVDEHPNWQSICLQY